VKAKEEVWDARNDIEELLDEATHALAERTRALAVACVQDGERIWHSGYANVFLNPEFTDLEATANVFSLLEEAQRLQDLFFKTMTGASPVEVVFGEELGWPGFRPIGFVGTRFSVAGKEGALGIIGPTRLPYSTVIPVLRYFKGLVQEVAGE
jgi:heat-inducible transcriptional repressor